MLGSNRWWLGVSMIIAALVAAIVLMSEGSFGQIALTFGVVMVGVQLFRLFLYWLSRDDP